MREGDLCFPRPLPKRRALSDREAAKVVLPELGRIYYTGSHHTNSAREATHDEHGRPIVASDGKGQLRAPIGGEFIDGDPEKRYRELMKAAGREVDPRAVSWGAYRKAGMDRARR
jgi:hypothetical protein